MQERKRISWWKVAAAVAPAVAVVCVCTSAFAQGPRGGMGRFELPAEKAAIVYETQAKTIAQDLGLNPEQTTKLVDAYKAARESYAKAAADLRGEGQRPDMQKVAELGRSERAKFETAVKGALDAEPAEKAVAALGDFGFGSFTWDRMVLALEDLNLDDAKKAEANKRVAQFAAESNKAREDAGGDMQAAREKMTALRDALHADLGKILTPEQLASFQEATRFGRGGGGGGGERRGGGGGR